MVYFVQVAGGAANANTHTIQFETETLRPRIHHPRRHGRPKDKWASSCLKDLWNILHPPISEAPIVFDIKSDAHLHEILELVYDYTTGARGLDPQYQEQPTEPTEELYLPGMPHMDDCNRWDSDTESIAPSHESVYSDTASPNATPVPSDQEDFDPPFGEHQAIEPNEAEDEAEENPFALPTGLDSP